MSRKLLLSLAATLGLASFAFLILFIATYSARLADERGNASEQVNRLLQVALENAMLKRDLPGLADIVNRLGQQPDITTVVIANPDRVVRFASNPALINQTMTSGDLGCATCPPGEIISRPPSTQSMRLADGREVLRSINPIANRAECKECHGAASAHPVNGILVVDHEASGLRREAMIAAAALSGAGLLVVLVGLGSHWLVLRRQVINPIAALERASRDLTDGRLDARVPLLHGHNDEVGALSMSFNRMAGTLESSMVALREQEAFLVGLMDTMPDGVRVLDESRRVVLANSSLARQVGVPRESLIGKPCYELHGRDAPCPPTLITCPFEAIKVDDAPIRYIHRHVRSDGSEMHVETTAARLTLEKAGEKRVLIVEAIRDLEQQIKYSHEQRLAEIGQLAAGIAHEIYNPLASVQIGVKALLDHIGDSAGDGQTASYLSMIDTEMEKCISVAKRLLDLSQVPSASEQLVSFAAVIPEVASLLAYEAERHGVSIRMGFAGSDLRVLATDAELRMVTLNLLQNAFHAMPDGGAITITGREDDRNVRIGVTDTGVGIDAGKLQQIFDPFYSKRADGVTGTGLGLTISKSIALRYGGDLLVESAPGAGSTFTIVLPRADTRLGGA